MFVSGKKRIMLTGNRNPKGVLMPIYVFKCQKCNHEFEKLLPVGKKASCPECHSCKVEKLITATITHSKNKRCDSSSSL